MVKKQDNERTIFDELKDNYKAKLNAAERQIEIAQRQVESDERALEVCRSPNEKPELQQDLRDSQAGLQEAFAQRAVILAELKELEK